MKNVFGYPEFDAEGEEILCTYDNAYSDMLMDIRVYRMEPGRKRDFCRRGEETAVLLLSGTVTFGWEGWTETARMHYNRGEQTREAKHELEPSDHLYE